MHGRPRCVEVQRSGRPHRPAWRHSPSPGRWCSLHIGVASRTAFKAVGAAVHAASAGVLRAALAGRTRREVRASGIPAALRREPRLLTSLGAAAGLWAEVPTR